MDPPEKILANWYPTHTREIIVLEGIKDYL